MRLTAHEFVAFDGLSDLFSACRAKHIFLTGGTGFVGKWLLESFLHVNARFNLNARLTVVSRDPDAFLFLNPWFGSETSLDFLKGDVRNFAFASGTADFVIHAATESGATPEQENSNSMSSVITEGTRHVLDLARQCSAKRFLYISSGAVYGRQPVALSHIPETYEGIPDTVYGKGKKDAEQMCLDAATGRFECVIARPFTFVGPYLPLDTRFAIGNFIGDCLEKRPIVIRGDGTPARSYLYAADLAGWLWSILLRGRDGRSYNVGSDEAISIFDLACRVRECAGTQNEIIVREKKVDGDMPARYVPSVERVKTELAVSRRHSLTDAIRRTIAWHRERQSKGL